jgi:hypothetical protein
MERNPWKLATIGLAVVGTTALGTGLTTAWMLRPPVPAVAQEQAPAAPAPLHYAAPAPRAVTPAPRAVTPAVVRTAPPVVRPVSTASEAPDCATGGERALRIAKPGAVGALLGAGIGAAGGAIADGKAGKGALIGGIAGAALGTGYGAYKTSQECGTIFGNGFSGPAPAYSASAPQAAFDDGGRNTVYHAR